MERPPRRLRLAVPVAEAAEQVQGLPQAGAGRWVVVSKLLHPSQIEQRVALPDPVTGLPVPGESLPEAGRGGRVVVRPLLHESLGVQRVGLAEPVTELAVQGQRLPLVRGPGRGRPRSAVWKMAKWLSASAWPCRSSAWRAAARAIRYSPMAWSQ